MSLYFLVFWCAEVILTAAQNPNSTEPKRYQPLWSDLDTRPLPEWYDRAKIGIMIHWGVYSVSAYQNEWFWKSLQQGNTKIDNLMKMYRPGTTYQELASMFTAEYFNALEWADLFKKAGARYVILTSKHHDGYTLFPSKESFSWNSVDVGPHKDLVNELSTAVRSYNMEFGLYYSLMEWFNPLYLEDRLIRNKAATVSNKFVRNKVWPEINQIISDYKPSILWTDGDWKDPVEYWNPTPVVAWLYNDSPIKDKIVINDRWGIGTRCSHGDIYTCDEVKNTSGNLPTHKWENLFTMDKLSYGYRKNMQLSDIISMEELIGTIVRTISYGGNALVNIGPTKEGTIPLVFQEKLLALGRWLGTNREAIYDTSPWLYQQDLENQNVWYTCNNSNYSALNSTAAPNVNDTVTAIYAIMLKYPKTNNLLLNQISSALRRGRYQVEMLEQPSNYLQWGFEHTNLVNVQLPDRAKLKSNYAWVLKFSRK